MRGSTGLKSDQIGLVGVRNGDTDPGKQDSNRQANMPEILVATPESFTLKPLGQKSIISAFFRICKTIVIDEWHDHH
ncbi:hypothetical protein [Chryseobacterium indoltheticum]|uniref:hypothetical protein n=1 Tax=Chryseobacterium indoltheticum TaxID=254 RepID=UPI003F49487D